MNNFFKNYKPVLMTRNRLILFLCFLFSSVASFAQTDLFTGTWHMQYLPNEKNTPIEIEIKIASAEKNQLYPAQLKLQCDSFSAVYDLLLVKRNSRQLGIGRNKIPESEAPFSIGNLTVFLNGTLDFSRDLKGSPVLSVSRIVTKQYGVTMPDLKQFTGNAAVTANKLKDFLKDTEIQFRKSNSEPWQDAHADSILSSHSTGNYFGILDTVYVNTRDCNINFPGNKKSDNGVVSVLLNGSAAIDQASLDYKKPSEEIVLDTGLNIIVFFADDYGRSAASTGKMVLSFGQKKLVLNFADKKDVAATFIVARIYYYQPKEERSSLENELSKLPSEYHTLNNDNVFYYPDKKRKNGLQNNLPGKPLHENTLLRDARLLGNVEVSSRQITLAIWDDAVEDGDSISLSINGNWIVQGLAVKKRPQFIIVTVEPGQNKITFIADNLGSIPPNTSVLEIIDGKKRKAFMIDTDLSQNNLINILYDIKPGG